MRSSDVRLWRRARRVLLLALTISLAPAAVSYVQAVTRPSNSSLGIQTVEWLRQNGASSLVSRVEDSYYSLTAPATGGPGLVALPHAGMTPAPTPARAGMTPAPTPAGAGMTPAPTPAGTPPASPRPRRRAARAAPYAPPRIPPVLHPALAGEGRWFPAAADFGAPPPVRLSTFRSEAGYPRLVAGVAWFDAHRTRLAYVPGLKEPSTPIPGRGTSEVPPGMRRNLVATFNGGFPVYSSGEGLAIGGRTYSPMRPGIGTVVQYAGGRVDVVSWHGGPAVRRPVVFAKQNLPLIVDHGRRNPNLSDGPEWGATVHNAIRVWRSGLGVDRRGNLIYAAANIQTVGTLAGILLRAGAVRALELDINEYWTSLITYRHRGARGPANLLPDMIRPATRYLTPDDRDFFAVYAR